MEMILIGSAVIAVLCIAFVWGRKSQRDALDTWGAAHGIELTEETRPLVDAYLERGLKWRTRGAFLGFVIPFGTDVPGLEMLLGYLIAAIAAEVTARPIVAAAPPRASLVPRTVLDYIPEYTLVWFRTLCAWAPLIVLALVLLPQRQEIRHVFGPVAVSAASILLFIAVELALRTTAQRRQPAAEPHFMAADDALRSAGMHAIVGAGISVAFLLNAAAWGLTMEASDVQVLRWVAPFAALFCFCAGISFWLQLGHDTPWRVQRSQVVRARA